MAREDDQPLGKQQGHELGELDVLPGDFAAGDPGLPQARLVDAGDRNLHVPRHQRQAEEAQDDGAGQYGVDLAGRQADGGRHDLHADHGQHDPGQDAHPIGPGLAGQRQRADFLQQGGVFFRGRCGE